MTIEPAVREDIQARLSRCEAEHDVKILYAVESGSRAWGFASPDSDYDVRFIYIRPTDWYLAYDIERKRDVIEYPIVDEIDINGWDLRKALYLFARTNGALLEWLGSPIVYRENHPAIEGLRALRASHISDVALCYHYSHMARGNAQQFLSADAVKLKKYFYVLRPLLAIRWIESGQGVPPVPFQELLDAQAPPEIIGEVEDLLETKRRTPELGKGPARPVINRFIEQEFERHGNTFTGQGRPELGNPQKRDLLNRLFQQALGWPSATQ